MIRNLIFDVGNVLVGYRWFEMLTDDYGLSKEDASRIGDEMFDKEIWEKGLDGGLLSLQDAIRTYGELYPEDLETITWFLQNGERMVVHRPEIWNFLPKLKEKGYKIYILSNYSQELFEAHTKDASFRQMLDGGIVSYEVKALKPGKRIYELLLEKYGLNAEECLFFDDREDNVEAARKLGFSAVQVTSEQMLAEELKLLTEE